MTLPSVSEEDLDKYDWEIDFALVGVGGGVRVSVMVIRESDFETEHSSIRVPVCTRSNFMKPSCSIVKFVQPTCQIED